jgi:hypothetical protein
VVDVLDDYQAALDHGVLVTPCLVLLDRDPLVTIVGTLKDDAAVREAMRACSRISDDG